MNIHFSSKTNEWATPQDIFDRLNAEFNFSLDPCATPNNAKCARYFTQEQNGLVQSWANERVFCNPPYGREISEWVAKAASEPCLTVMLIPARTDTSYWHKHIFDNPRVEIRFLKGRLKFGDAKNSAPFPSAIVIFNERGER